MRSRPASSLEECYEEEGENEYASYKQGDKNGHEEAHIEPAILLQPLTSEEPDYEPHSSLKGQVHLCTEHGSEVGQLCDASFLGKLRRAATDAWHVVKHIIAPGPAPSDEIRDKIGSDPPWAEEGAQDLDDWGFDDVEWDW